MSKGKDIDVNPSEYSEDDKLLDRLGGKDPKLKPGDDELAIMLLAHRKDVERG